MEAVYSYSGDPSASTKDMVRFLIGDTCDPWLLSDIEIEFVASKEANAYTAGAECVRRILAFYARKVNKSAGGLSVNYESVTRQYREMLEDLERRGRASQIPEAGGISIDDKKTLELDTDWPRPDFRKGQFERDDVPSQDPYTSPEELA
jgi:hypothetical protein